MKISNTLSANSYFTVNKAIARELSLGAAVLISELIYRHDFFEQRGHLTEEGAFFATSSDLSEACCMNRRPFDTAIRELKKAGFINTEKIGMPAKTHYMINDDEIERFLSASKQVCAKRTNKVVQNVQTNNKNKLIRNNSNTLRANWTAFKDMYTGRVGLSGGSDKLFAKLSEQEQLRCIRYLGDNTTDSYTPYSAKVIKLVQAGEDLQESRGADTPKKRWS